MSPPTRWTGVRAIVLGLAAMHLLPASHHLGDFVARPSVADGWKGIGAALAVALLASGPRGIGRVVALLRRAGSLAWPAARAILALAHLVPLADHLPRALAAPCWADGWRAGGALVAIMVFAAPPRWWRRVLSMRAAPAPLAPHSTPTSSSS